MYVDLHAVHGYIMHVQTACICMNAVTSPIEIVYIVYGMQRGLACMSLALVHGPRPAPTRAHPIVQPFHIHALHFV